MKKHTIFELDLIEIKDAISNYMSYKDEYNTDSESVKFIYNESGEVIGLTIEDY